MEIKEEILQKAVELLDLLPWSDESNWEEKHSLTINNNTIIEKRSDFIFSLLINGKPHVINRDELAQWLNTIRDTPGTKLEKNT